jgi:hypothetical protein
MFARIDFRLRLFFSIRLIAELTKPGICALADDVRKSDKAETVNVTNKLNETNFFMMPFLSKT